MVNLFIGKGGYIMKLDFETLKTKAVYFLYFFLNIVFSELVVRFFSLGVKSGVPIFMVLFALSTAFLLSSVCTLFGKKTRCVLSFVFSTALFIIFAVQLVYYRFCDSFMSVIQLAMGADAMESFGEAAKLEIIESLGGIALLLIPIIALIVVNIKVKFKSKRTRIGAFVLELVAFFLLHFCTVACLPLQGTQLYSPYDIYNNTFVLAMSEKDFGVLTSLRLELRGLIFGTKDSEVIFLPDDVQDETDSEADTKTEDTQPEVEVIEYAYNNTDIDFDALIASEQDKEIAQLHSYFKMQSGTKQNEYTGKFKDYNLILICAESFSGHVIDKELTPTLYKMANEGFVFSDYYNTVCDNTSNGEYAILTGLIPDTSLLGKGWNNFYSYNSFTVSKENHFPFSLGKQFSALDANSYAFHNYKYDYYGRHMTHTNLGYDFKAMYSGLKVVSDWPTSDVSMMEQTLPMLLGKDENGSVKPFHAYFLTFSGHMPYVFSSNTMANKNKALVSELPYSSAVKAYVACQLELEASLAYLLEELEAAGVLENTLIALTNDHYPYPLGLSGLSELSGKELDEHFDKYRSDFLLWSASMTEPVVVDTTCCSLDILPTLSNLLGLEYDSRLLMGKDIFAEGDHIAVLADRSFVTDKVYYNCTSGETVLREGVAELPEGYIDRLQMEVHNKFTLSEKILYKDYYGKVYLN